MAINVPALIPQTQNLSVNDQVGSMVIGTANIPAQGNYLTIVLRGGVPFDMGVSLTVEEALETHAKFVDAATLLCALMDELAQEGDSRMLN